MTSSHREQRQPDAPTRPDLDEPILVWNGAMARTERSSSQPARPVRYPSAPCGDERLGRREVPALGAAEILSDAGPNDGAERTAKRRTLASGQEM
jgi:hypothetical protein